MARFRAAPHVATITALLTSPALLPNLLRRDSHQKNIIRGPRVLNECASAWPTMPEADSTTDQATDASTGSRVAFSSVSLRSLAVSFSGDFWALVSGEHTERPSK